MSANHIANGGRPHFGGGTLTRLLHWVVLAACFLFLASSAFAQQTARVGVSISPPFVMAGQDGAYTGMAIDLWEEMATREGLSTTYIEYPNPRALIAATANGEIDIAVSNLTITRTRMEQVDFTQPWYDSGFRILIQDRRGAGFWDVLAGLADAGYLRAYAWLAAVIAFATVALTLFDRRFDKDFPKDWLSGVAESFYHVMSVATSGKTARKRMFGAWGRMFSAIWLVCGIAVLAYVTASVTSVMTAFTILNNIESAADLPGKRVGVVDGTTAEEYARNNGFITLEYPDLQTAASALRAGALQAIVGDAPVLEFFVTEDNEDLDVVGPIFNPEKYGFATPITTNFDRNISIDLLDFREAGELERLRVRYFGEDD